MKKFTIAFLAALPLLACLASPASAASQARGQGNFPFPTGDRHDWGIGTEIYYYNYEEPAFMENEGAKYGLDAHYKYKSPERWSVKVEGRGAWGTVDYWSNGTGTDENIKEGTFELRLTGGYDFVLAPDWTLTPYVGVGYRYLKNAGGGTVTTTGHLGYDRISQYLYSPIGLELVYDTQRQWTIGATIEYDIFYRGWQESRFGTAIPGFGDTNNTQDGGYGWRGSLPFRKKGDRFDIVIEPYVRWWHIDDSDVQAITAGGFVVDFGLEPANDTFESGLKLDFIF